MGVFGESFVTEVPDLPLILALNKAHKSGEPFPDPNYATDPLFVAYCIQRGINPGYLLAYLNGISLLLEATFEKLTDVEFVGFSVWNSNYLTTLMAAATLKRRGGRAPFVVLGGPQVTESNSAAILALRTHLCDAVILGEGEASLKALYEEYRAPASNWKAIGGILALGEDGKSAQGRPERLLKMHDLPTPDFEQMDIASYRSGRSGIVLPMQMSRGCTDKCSFCSEWAFWQRFRSDSVDHVLDQVQSLRQLYNMAGIAFTDSLLNGSIKRLQEFSERLLTKQVSLRWGGFMRANMDLETAKLLKRAGCVLAFIGVESLNDQTLSLMKKRRTESDNLNALRAFLAAGIAVRAGIIPGFPGDTRERFLGTARILGDLQREFPGLLALSVEPFVVSPGQAIFKDLKAFGLSPNAWSDEYLDLAPELRDVTDNIVCSVEGPNQGLERLGQYQIAIALSQNGRTRGEIQRRALSPSESDFMYYSYNPEEIESQHEMQFSPVGEDFYLGTLKTKHGLRWGCLVSYTEKICIESQARSTNAAAPWTLPGGLLEQRWFIDTVDAAERWHLAKLPRDHVGVVRSQHLANPSPASAVCLSPFVLARKVEKDASARVFAVHVLNKSTIELPDYTEVFFRRLGEGRCLARDLIEAAPADRANPAEVWTVLAQLIEKGFLLGHGLGAKNGKRWPRITLLQREGVQREGTPAR